MLLLINITLELLRGKRALESWILALKRLSFPRRRVISFTLSFPPSVLYRQSLLACGHSLLIFFCTSFCANFIPVCSKVVLLISFWDLRITFTEPELICSGRVAKRWEVLKVFKTFCIYFLLVLHGKELNLIQQKDVWSLPSGFWPQCLSPWNVTLIAVVLCHTNNMI